MQSVVSCLLAIKRIMSERKVIPTKPTSEFLTTGRKSGSRNSQLLLTTPLPPSPPTAATCNSSAYNVLQVNKNVSTCRPSHQKRFSNSSFNDEKKLLPSPPTTPPTANITAAHQYLLHTKAKSANAPYIPTSNKANTSGEWPKRFTNARRGSEFTVDANKISLEKKFQQKSASSGNKGGNGAGGYVKSQVHMITTNNHLTVVEPNLVTVKRYSASDNTNDMTTERVKAAKGSNPMPKPSKSTPLVAATNVTVTAKTTATKKKTTADNKMKYYTDYNNRKTSLKKMGSCAITVESDDGKSAVYVSLAGQCDECSGYILNPPLIETGFGEKHWQRPVWRSIWRSQYGHWRVRSH